MESKDMKRCLMLVGAFVSTFSQAHGVVKQITRMPPIEKLNAQDTDERMTSRYAAFTPPLFKTSEIETQRAREGHDQWINLTLEANKFVNTEVNAGRAPSRYKDDIANLSAILNFINRTITNKTAQKEELLSWIKSALEIRNAALDEIKRTTPIPQSWLDSIPAKSSNILGEDQAVLDKYIASIEGIKSLTQLDPMVKAATPTLMKATELINKLEQYEYRLAEEIKRHPVILRNRKMDLAYAGDLKRQIQRLRGWMLTTLDVLRVSNTSDKSSIIILRQAILYVDALNQLKKELRF